MEWRQLPDRAIGLVRSFIRPPARLRAGKRTLHRAPASGGRCGRVAVGGADFGYHGDFDWGGVRIARAVRHRVTWWPWRYDHLAYQAAVSAAHQLAPLARLTGEPARLDRPESDGDSVLPDLAVWEGFCVIYGNPAGPCRTR